MLTEDNLDPNDLIMYLGPDGSDSDLPSLFS